MYALRMGVVCTTEYERTSTENSRVCRKLARSKSCCFPSSNWSSWDWPNRKWRKTLPPAGRARALSSIRQVVLLSRYHAHTVSVHQIDAMGWINWPSQLVVAVCLRHTAAYRRILAGAGSNLIWPKYESNIKANKRKYSCIVSRAKAGSALYILSI